MEANHIGNPFDDAQHPAGDNDDPSRPLESGNKITNALLITLVILVTASTSLVGGLIVGSPSGDQVTTATNETEEIHDPEAEYYRGIYDICFQQTRKTEFCMKTVRKVTDANWFDKPSNGWTWPLDADGTVAQVEE